VAGYYDIMLTESKTSGLTKITTGKFLNGFRSKQKLPDNINGCSVKFNSLSIDDHTQRRTFLQSIASSLSKLGYDISVGPLDMNSFDLVILSMDLSSAETLMKKRYPNLNPVVTAIEKVHSSLVLSAWRNKIRAHLSSHGYLKIGPQYVPESEIVNNKKEYKDSFKIEGEIIDNYPVVWIDYKTKIMIPLSVEDIKKAAILGDQSDVAVRVLPHWNYGIIVGKTGKLAQDETFPHNNRNLVTADYWKYRHGIEFVKNVDEMVSVLIPDFQRTLPYPTSCVFKEYRVSSLPSSLKKFPQERVRLTTDFVQQKMSNITFLGKKIEFEGPMDAGSFGYKHSSFPGSSQMKIRVGNGQSTSCYSIHDSLKINGPYAGQVNGRYIVIHHGNKEKIAVALRYMESVYNKLHFGTIKIAEEVGDRGFIDAGGSNTVDFTSAVTKIRSKISSNEKFFVFLIIPSVYSADIYYKTRSYLFQRVFGEAFPCQAMGYETIEKIVNEDKGKYAIAVNTCSQTYVKLGGTGYATWILNDPADSKIPGIVQGTSCYAYHDVSRRVHLKSSATAYSAMTDSYGRYIATGNRPAGGEKLAPSNFYDILFDLVQKISLFSERFADDSKIKFNFERLVFAKDGLLRHDEADMMEDVIRNGIPEENKEPIGNILKRIYDEDKKLVIDIIGVNKSPNKRVFDFNGGYSNVEEGTAIIYNGKVGLLISAKSQFGTSQPLEISLMKHIVINTNDVPIPHISQIMEEYYKLTKLNWGSVFNQGKLALPQILTQNLGENLSYGVSVPDNMVLL